MAEISTETGSEAASIFAGQVAYLDRGVGSHVG